MMQRNSMDKPPALSDLQIGLLGKTGAGKSASGNTIIGRDRDTFKEGFFPGSKTKICQTSNTKVTGQKITVIDTIGLLDPSKKETTPQNKIEQIFDCTEDGVDLFLLLIKLGEKYTEEEENNLKQMWIQEIFGAKVLKHTIVLFTHGDMLLVSIEECLSQSDTLRTVVDQCAGRYHVFNNRDEDRSQVTELLGKIESLRKMNRNNRYTKQNYEENLKKLQDEKAKREAAEKQQKILKDAAEAAKEQEGLLRRAEEERERLLKEAAETAKEHEGLLRRAEERERLLKKAAEAAKEQERLLRKAEEERKRLLKQAAEAAKEKEQSLGSAAVGGIGAAVGGLGAAALSFVLFKK